MDYEYYFKFYEIAINYKTSSEPVRTPHETLKNK